jgi:hypothetical protein
MPRSLQDALEETLGFIKRALDHIGAAEGAEAELHNVRAYLLNILELVLRAIEHTLMFVRQSANALSEARHTQRELAIDGSLLEALASDRR